jgi:hypothetical protein
MPTSRSVAARSRLPFFAVPLASSNTFARIGMVLRFSTIDWMRARPRWNSAFEMENFIGGIPIFIFSGSEDLSVVVVEA